MLMGMNPVGNFRGTKHVSFVTSEAAERDDKIARRVSLKLILEGPMDELFKVLRPK